MLKCFYTFMILIFSSIFLLAEEGNSISKKNQVAIFGSSTFNSPKFKINGEDKFVGEIKEDKKNNNGIGFSYTREITEKFSIGVESAISVNGSKKTFENEKYKLESELQNAANMMLVFNYSLFKTSKHNLFVSAGAGLDLASIKVSVEPKIKNNNINTTNNGEATITLPGGQIQGNLRDYCLANIPNGYEERDLVGTTATGGININNNVTNVGGNVICTFRKNDSNSMTSVGGSSETSTNFGASFAYSAGVGYSYSFTDKFALVSKISYIGTSDMSFSFKGADSTSISGNKIKNLGGVNVKIGLGYTF
jgi:opacity protein-like surface antigen